MSRCEPPRSLGVAVAVGLKRLNKRLKGKRLIDALNVTLASYLDAARRAELTVGQIDDLSEAIERVRAKTSKESILITKQVVKLVKAYTAQLAEANESFWVPEQDADVEPLIRLEHSLETQRQILGAAARGP